jgi:hypothetical protein
VNGFPTPAAFRCKKGVFFGASTGAVEASHWRARTAVAEFSAVIAAIKEHALSMAEKEWSVARGRQQF